MRGGCKSLQYSNLSSRQSLLRSTPTLASAGQQFEQHGGKGLPPSNINQRSIKTAFSLEGRNPLRPLAIDSNRNGGKGLPPSNITINNLPFTTHAALQHQSPFTQFTTHRLQRTPPSNGNPSLNLCVLALFAFNPLLPLPLHSQQPDQALTSSSFFAIFALFTVNYFCICRLD